MTEADKSMRVRDGGAGNAIHHKNTDRSFFGAARNLHPRLIIPNDPSRARMPGTVIAQVGSARRVVGFEPLHAILLSIAVGRVGVASIDLGRSDIAYVAIVIGRVAVVGVIVIRIRSPGPPIRCAAEQCASGKTGAKAAVVPAMIPVATAPTRIAPAESAIGCERS